MASEPRRPSNRRARTVFGVLVLAALTVITLDARPSGDSPVDPLRAGAGAVFGPLESGVSAVVRPVVDLPGYFGSVDALEHDNARLEKQNAALRAELRTSAHARQRAGELDQLLGVTQDTGTSVVPARVVMMGAAQAFSRTVMIDAGRRDGVLPDMTVLNGDGLVGRVIGATRTTATVLLIIDAKSVVGGRLGSSSELGFLNGDGDIGYDGRLSLELVDDVREPGKGDTVVTWGSRDDAPYVAGVPIGTVTQVRSSPRQLSKTAVVEPFVDFSALDLVGVVVGTEGRGARGVVDRAAGAGR